MATETPPRFDRWADQLSRLSGPSPLRGNCLVPLFDDCTARNREAVQTFCGPAAPSRELILIVVQGRLTSGVLMRLMTFDGPTQSFFFNTLTPPPTELLHFHPETKHLMTTEVRREMVAF